MVESQNLCQKRLEFVTNKMVKFKPNSMSEFMSTRMSEPAPNRMAEFVSDRREGDFCEIECETRQILCQIEGQDKCHIECQNLCPLQC